MIQLKQRCFLFLALLLLLVSSSGCNQEHIPKQKKHSTNNTIDTPPQHLPFHGVKSEKGKMNILIVGIDSRGEKHSRSDSIMIAQYDSIHQKVQVASIMRDCFVFIPTYKQKYNKINTAYFLGGPELLRQTIKDNFQIDVEHYVAIDFQGFIKIVDMVAPEGIEVDVKQTIIEDMNLDLQPGIQRLHGQELLAYARFRHDGESDFGRVRRQQEIITALKEEFTSQLNNFDGILRLTKTGQEVMDYVETDMPLSTVLTLSGEILFNQIKSIHTMRIPIQNSYEDKQYNHAGRVLDLDVGKNRDALKQFFNGGDETKVEEKEN